MLSCHACSRTCLRAVVSDALICSPLVTAGNARRRIFPSSPPQLRPPRRWATTDLAVHRKSAADNGLGLADGGEVPPARSQTYPRAVLERELQYLSDPLKLAKNTLLLLRKDVHDKALELVRLASRTMDCTVSWNHLIDYNMSKGRITAAIKTYNEMKKRAQRPDAYTYTLLLRGLAAHVDFPQSLPRALSIYNSMYNENAPVKPSIIHTNAILNVCARARDLDAIFEIAAKLPSKGKGAADTWTFTTIFNAIGNAASHESRQLHHINPEKAFEPIRRAVVQGRRMWSDIIGRWLGGEMLLDEELVCAMGWILIRGNTLRDLDDVLSLVEQTMGIPRKLPRLGDPARTSHLNEPRQVVPSANGLAHGTAAEHASEDNRSLPQGGILGSKDTLEHASDSSQASSSPSIPSKGSSDIPNEFDPVPLNPSAPPRSIPRPSQRTLSLLVSATTQMGASSAAQRYWGLLTGTPYNIVPDSENLHTYLRLLRLARASRLSAILVADMAKPRGQGGLGILPVAKTYRIAMSTCVRESKNNNASVHAIALLRMMKDGLEEPDIPTCSSFITIMQKTLTITGGKEWKTVLEGLNEFEIVVQNLRSALAYGNWKPTNTEGAAASPEVGVSTPEGPYRPPRPLPRTPYDSPAERRRPGQEVRREVRLLIQRMVSLYDRVTEVAKETLEPRDLRRIAGRRGRLSAWVGRELEREGSRAARKREWENKAGDRRDGEISASRGQREYGRVGDEEEEEVVEEEEEEEWNQGVHEGVQGGQEEGLRGQEGGRVVESRSQWREGRRGSAQAWGGKPRGNIGEGHDLGQGQRPRGS